MATGSDDRLLTRKEAARMLGFRPQTLARWKWAGREDRPPEVVLGRAIRYSLRAIAAWLEKHSETPPTGREEAR